MKKISAISHFKLILITFLVLIYSCQTDDYKVDQVNEINHPIQIDSKTVTSKDIPKVMQFIRTQSDKDLLFTLDSFTNIGNRSNSNLIIGTLDHNNISQITDNQNVSNYTFNMIKSDSNSEVSIVNYIVKESGDSYYGYFLEFIPDSVWLKETIEPNDLSQYSGIINIFDRKGDYIGSNTFVNGQNISQTSRTACDPVGDNDQDNNPAGNGGADTTPPSGDEPPGGNGDVSDNGNGGQDIECVIINIEPCNCSDGPGQVITVNACDGQKNNIIRTPCDNECSSQIDCEFGYDDNCNCLENPDNENPSDAIIVNLAVIASLNDLLEANDSYIYPADVDSNNALYFDTVEQFADYIQNPEFDLNQPLIDTDEGNRITSFRVDYGLTNVDIFVNQILNNPIENQAYEFVEVTSELSGITLGTSWEQTAVQHTVVGNEAIITVFGNLNYNLFLESIGTIYKDTKIFELHIDINTGEPISIFDIED